MPSGNPPAEGVAVASYVSGGTQPRVAGGPRPRVAGGPQPRVSGGPQPGLDQLARFVEQACDGCGLFFPPAGRQEPANGPWTGPADRIRLLIDLEKVAPQAGAADGYRLRVVAGLEVWSAPGTSVRLAGGRDARPFARRSLESRFGFTRREAAVARLLAERKPNQEIARVLFVSPHTARHHTQHLMLKLGVRSRTAAAARILAD